MTTWQGLKFLKRGVSSPLPSASTLISSSCLYSHLHSFHHVSLSFVLLYCPFFGSAVLHGSINSFYPLNTISTSVGHLHFDLKQKSSCKWMLPDQSLYNSAVFPILYNTICIQHVHQINIINVVYNVWI